MSDDVVAQAAPVREAAEVAVEHAEAALVGRRRGRHAEVDLQRVGRGRLGAICVWPGMPVSSAWTMSVRLCS